MHATMVTFTYEVMDPGTMARLQRERAGLYDAIPGLVSKTSWIDAAANACGAFYLSDLPRPRTPSEWRARVLAVYGAGSMEVRPLEVTARSDG